MTIPFAPRNAAVTIGIRLDAAVQADILAARLIRPLQDRVETVSHLLRRCSARLNERDLMRLAPRGEEVFQQYGSLRAGDPAVNFGLVMTRWR